MKLGPELVSNPGIDGNPPLNWSSQEGGLNGDGILTLISGTESWIVIGVGDLDSVLEKNANYILTFDLTFDENRDNSGVSIELARYNPGDMNPIDIGNIPNQVANNGTKKFYFSTTNETVTSNVIGFRATGPLDTLSAGSIDNVSIKRILKIPNNIQIF